MLKLNQKGITHILVVILLLAGLGATLYLSQHTQIFKPKAFELFQQDEITDLTNQLLSSKERYDQTLSAGGRTPNSDEIRRIASQRKEALLKEAQSNPKAFLDHATLVSKRSSFPSEVQPFIEEEKTVQGELLSLHWDNFENQVSENLYAIKTDENKTYDLYFAKGEPSNLPGSTVSARGVSINLSIVSSELVTISPVIFPIGFGPYKTAVILFNEDPEIIPDPNVKTRVKNMMFEADDSVNQFFIKSSYGKVFLEGEVFGWFDLQLPKIICGDYTAGQEAIRIVKETAERNGIRLDQYRRSVFIMSPGSLLCGNGGGGTVTGLDESRIVYISIDSLNSYVIAHELGHTFGLGHAGRDHDEYGDASDVMGAYGKFMQPNGPHKLSIGWIERSSMQTVTETGTYTISPPTELPDKYKLHPQILRIPVQFANGTSGFYYLSYRQPIGFDKELEQTFTTGVNIHQIGSFQGIATESLTTIVDTLQDDKTYTDKLNQIQIKQLSHDANSVTVEVKFNALSPPSPTPTASTSITPNPSRTPFPSSTPQPYTTP